MKVAGYRSMSDGVLCRMASQGDMSALEELYRRNVAALLDYGLRYCRDRELVEDCIQDLFVRLCLRPRVLESVENVRGYLLMTLRNTVADALSGSGDEVSIDGIPDTPDIDAFLEFETGGVGDEELARRRRLVEGLHKLSSRHRHVLYLYFVQGLSHREIAAMMGMEPQSSKNLVFRIVSKLRRLLVLFV